MEEKIREPIEETMSEEVVVENENTNSGLNDDALKSAIEEQLSKIRRQSMLLGCQVMCKTILDKIYVSMNKQGKKTNNDYRRLIKDIEAFCKTGLSRNVNADDETEPAEENNTKLMEDADEGNTNKSNTESSISD